MPLISIDLVDVGERIRRDMDIDWKTFCQSIIVHGQLQPIRVVKLENGRYDLIAGWRRLSAITAIHKQGSSIKNLPPNMIEIAEPEQEIPPLHTRLLREFAENNERQDFTFIDKARFIRFFHEMMISTYGKDTWTQELTANQLNLSAASISHYLRVEQAAAEDDSIAKAQTLDAAVKRMKVNERVKTRIRQAEQEDTTSVSRAQEILRLGDARALIKSIPDNSIDFVNFDPPWGEDASHKSQENHESFDDSTEYAGDLMKALLPEIYRVLKPDRFCAFWHRLWATERMGALAESFGFNLTFTRTPAIWAKLDKVTDQNRFPEKQLIEAYEPFFLLRKGDPLFHEKFTNNVFPFDRVKLGSVVHPTEKPLELCNAIVRLCTVPGETILDPTAGSASMAESAIRNNRKCIGFELSEKYHERGIARLADYLKTFSV